ncbi:SGNH/GDSL hydrolase family protein [Terriglobus albidus]|nr:SGNH/GDSL hydrolase family protein [Terriglobus albidus]
MRRFAVIALGLSVGVAWCQAPASEQNPVPEQQVVKPAEAAAPATPVSVPVQKPPVPDQISMPTDKTIAGLQGRVLDFAQLSRYREDNAKLAPPAPGEKRVVFYGDSITDAWGRRSGKFFPGKPWINRGISGQTTQQMLIRFEQDVVHLKPVAVVILAGTNDVAGNTGPENLQMIQDNITSMVAIAKANNIRVVLASVLPAKKFGWNPDVQPAETIRTLNQWIEQYCTKEKLTFLNYYPALVDNEGGMKEDLAADKTVHPNDAGYAVMEPLAQAAVEKALK